MYFILPKNNTDSYGLLHADAPIFASISASSTQAETEKYVTNLVNYSSDHWWCSENSTDQYFIVSFRRPVYIFNISLAVNNWNKSNEYPKNIHAYGIINGNEREVHHADDIQLNFQNITKTVPLSDYGPYDKIKVMHSGLNTNKHYYFCLSKFDVFGHPATLFSLQKTNIHIPISLIGIFLVFSP